MAKQFGGVYAAMPVPFCEDYSIDTAELERLTEWLIGHDGIAGLVTNGIAGEVFALDPDERAEVTRIVAGVAGGRVPVISGLYCERLDEVRDHGMAAKAVGATSLLVMPPGRWLRYGMDDSHVTEYFRQVGATTGLPLVAHMYPAWTKAAYSRDTLRELAAMSEVAAFKIGTREMAEYEANIRIIRETNADAAVLTCQDEYLLASMAVGVDGAMVGFASFVPELVTALYAAVSDCDLKQAQDIYEMAYPLNRLVYGNDHPNYENYPRMKTAMMLSGRLASDVVRPPIAPTSPESRAAIQAVLENSRLEMSGVMV